MPRESSPTPVVAPAPVRIAVVCWVAVALVFVANLVVIALGAVAAFRAGIVPIGLALFGLYGAGKLVGGQRSGRTIAVVAGAVLAVFRLVGLLVLVLDRVTAAQPTAVDGFAVFVSASVLTLVAAATWAMFRPEVEPFLRAAAVP